MFITGGSFALKEFSTVRYEISRHNKQFGLTVLLIAAVTPELLKEMGFDKNKPKSLEEEYESMTKTADLDNWKNIRGPRPWEEDSVEYKQMIENRINELQKKRR
ncbi:unnamed protein product [Medioppia subpectinata]|uniref:Cytochrome c oxidase assembly protein COX16 homolog, mitochondrial n=1 Tax=Medioppia subpectinata TaxID=1979941 RepID=A0A7R9PUY8_9ACAR|nr:unnamed protein product [Medioppia subpectinata]CAG2101737.1 unnamed protein product [Medioppia subpectinata]